jgi:ribosomal protein S24E
MSYSASAVKIYNATSSLVRFESKYILFFFKKNVTITAVESRSIPADQLFLLSDIVLFPF